MRTHRTRSHSSCLLNCVLAISRWWAPRRNPSPLKKAGTRPNNKSIGIQRAVRETRLSPRAPMMTNGPRLTRVKLPRHPFASTRSPICGALTRPCATGRLPFQPGPRIFRENVTGPRFSLPFNHPGREIYLLRGGSGGLGGARFERENATWRTAGETFTFTSLSSRIKSSV